jgi:hypothetical protein
LNGQNEKALEWIAEGVRRNREGHFGTEWLHVKILKAKIFLENSSEWLNSNSILGIEFPADSRPESDLSISDDFGIKRNLPAIESALIYQLHERLEFVKPQEPVVADLLYDLSRIFKLTRSPEHSAAIKELAGQYGPGHERKSLNTNDANASRTLTPPFRKYLFLGGLGVIGILLALGVLRFVFMGRGR